jgi:hypothetical protein
MAEAMVEKTVNAINESLINFFKQGTTSNLRERSYGTNNIGGTFKIKGAIRAP